MEVFQFHKLCFCFAVKHPWDVCILLAPLAGTAASLRLRALLRALHCSRFGVALIHFPEQRLVFT